MAFSFLSAGPDAVASGTIGMGWDRALARRKKVGSLKFKKKIGRVSWADGGTYEWGSEGDFGEIYFSRPG